MQMEVLSPQQIINKAISLYKPVAIYAGFSGGRDSIATVHWMMNNVPGTEVVHFNTGIGIERSRVFVRETCASYGWKLHEIRAKEDCGQDYEELVKRFGFPGPDGHGMMYARLKERAVRLLVKRSKKNRNDKVLIATGIRHDESLRRMQYATREVNTVGAQAEQHRALSEEQRESVRYAAEWLGRSEDIGNRKHAERLALLANGGKHVER
jgi:3'-phosphoadenosine 5'-phosphosulfate sulfotransferase (PAPS reductase)/FAD synthetase